MDLQQQHAVLHFQGGWWK